MKSSAVYVPYVKRLSPYLQRRKDLSHGQLEAYAEKLWSLAERIRTPGVSELTVAQEVARLFAPVTDWDAIRLVEVFGIKERPASKHEAVRLVERALIASLRGKALPKRKKALSPEDPDGLFEKVFIQITRLANRVIDALDMPLAQLEVKIDQLLEGLTDNQVTRMVARFGGNAVSSVEGAARAIAQAITRKNKHLPRLRKKAIEERRTARGHRRCYDTVAKKWVKCPDREQHQQTKQGRRGMAEKVVESVVRSGRALVPGLGVFKTRVSPAHLARNPRTGGTVRVPARRKLVFRMGAGIGQQLVQRRRMIQAAQEMEAQGDTEGAADVRRRLQPSQGQRGMSEQILNELASKGRVLIPGFGIIKTRVSKPYKARNPRTGGVINVPARLKIIFKPSAGVESELTSHLGVTGKSLPYSGAKGCVPNKTGTGYHDSDTGHPCTPHKEDMPVQRGRRKQRRKQERGRRGQSQREESPTRKPNRLDRAIISTIRTVRAIRDAGGEIKDRFLRTAVKAQHIVDTAIDLVIPSWLPEDSREIVKEAIVDAVADMISGGGNKDAAMGEVPLPLKVAGTAISWALYKAKQGIGWLTGKKPRVEETPPPKKEASLPIQAGKALDMSGVDVDAITDAVEKVYAQLSELAGEKVRPVNKGKLRERLLESLSQGGEKTMSAYTETSGGALVPPPRVGTKAITLPRVGTKAEGGAGGSGSCVPNKTGQGYHDDQTGHPCTPGGGTQEGGDTGRGRGGGEKPKSRAELKKERRARKQARRAQERAGQQERVPAKEKAKRAAVKLAKGVIGAVKAIKKIGGAAVEILNDAEHGASTAIDTVVQQILPVPKELQGAARTAITATIIEQAHKLVLGGGLDLGALQKISTTGEVSATSAAMVGVGYAMVRKLKEVGLLGKAPSEIGPELSEEQRAEIRKENEARKQDEKEREIARRAAARGDDSDLREVERRVRARMERKRGKKKRKRDGGEAGTQRASSLPGGWARKGLEGKVDPDKVVAGLEKLYLELIKIMKIEPRTIDKEALKRSVEESLKNSGNSDNKHLPLSYYSRGGLYASTTRGIKMARRRETEQDKRGRDIRVQEWTVDLAGRMRRDMTATNADYLIRSLQAASRDDHLGLEGFRELLKRVFETDAFRGSRAQMLKQAIQIIDMRAVSYTQTRF